MIEIAVTCFVGRGKQSKIPTEAMEFVKICLQKNIPIPPRCVGDIVANLFEKLETVPIGMKFLQEILTSCPTALDKLSLTMMITPLCKFKENYHEAYVLYEVSKKLGIELSPVHFF